MEFFIIDNTGVPRKEQRETPRLWALGGAPQPAVKSVSIVPNHKAPNLSVGVRSAPSVSDLSRATSMPPARAPSVWEHSDLQLRVICSGASGKERYIVKWVGGDSKIKSGPWSLIRQIQLCWVVTMVQSAPRQERGVAVQSHECVAVAGPAVLSGAAPWPQLLHVCYAASARILRSSEQPARQQGPWSRGCVHGAEGVCRMEQRVCVAK